MLVTSMSVITIIENKDEKDGAVIKPSDINLIFNYIHATPSFKTDKTWTPICIPGISEEFLLHVYIEFFNDDLGIIYISAEEGEDILDSYQDNSKAVFYELEKSGIYNKLKTYNERTFLQVNMKELE